MNQKTTEPAYVVVLNKLTLYLDNMVDEYLPTVPVFQFDYW